MTVQAHPVSKLLTDEMRERVRAATFVRDGDGIATPGTDCRCPFAVALDYPGPGWPDENEIAAALGVTSPVMIDAIQELLADFDEGRVEPDDVYALLDASRQPAEPPERGS